ncbi:MAG: Flp family type IVb pilin [Pseudomonadota bacterium]|nr:Flp family type IVb pilin [Pseudomonadota bacterium]
MMKFIKLLKDSRGATAIEYGLIAALIAVAAIAALRSVGTELETTFDSVGTELATANTPPAA